MQQYQKSTSNGSPQFQPRATFVRVSRKRPCEICHKPDNCNVSADGRIAYCRRVRGDKQGRDGGWVHILTHDSPPPKITPPRPSSEPIAERAGVDHLDAIYSTLIRKHLVLSEDHKQQLLKRGLAVADIEHAGYRSMPTLAYADAVARALGEFDLRGVPGFYRCNGSAGNGECGTWL